MSLLIACTLACQIELKAAEREHLWLEPVIVTVRADRPIPAAPGEKLRFEVEPLLKTRAKPRPLYVEGKAADLAVHVRDFDLFEWYEFPKAGGTWKVRAVLDVDGTALRSEPVELSARPAAKDDAEHAPMSRIHHPPWSNYETDRFCGDTFDLVAKWPESRYAKYARYWSARYLHSQGDHEKALAEYRALLDTHAGFALADDAEYAIAECLLALKKADEAAKVLGGLRKRSDRTAARVLAERLVER